MPDRWPLAEAAEVLDVYRPLGGPSSDAPLRTLRRNGAMSPGIRVTIREGRRFSGSCRVYSELNLDAARLARRGDSNSARVYAAAAGRLEEKIADMVATMSPDTITSRRAPDSDEHAVREISQATRSVRQALPALPEIERFVGTLESFDGTSARVVTAGGQAFDLPQHLAFRLGARLGDWVMITREDVGTSVLVRLEPMVSGAGDFPGARLTAGETESATPDGDYLRLMTEGFDDPDIAAAIRRVGSDHALPRTDVVNLVG